MNRILGILTLNHYPISDVTLKECGFNTPWWQPDHEQILIQPPIGLSVKQRFITPQCQNGLMPLIHHPTGCVMVADVYLTDRSYLVEILSLNKDASDAELLLHAYLKWGTQCTSYLFGRFVFVVWDPREQQLFMARDQLGHRTLFYAYKPQQYLIFANEFSPFRQLLPQVTPNETLFLEYAFDNYPFEMTGYQEVNKLDAAQQLLFKKGTSHLQKSTYWKLQKKPLFDHSYKTRNDYYEHFTQQFKQATLACLRTHYPMTAQLSGGLDSSSVVAQAASLLKSEGKNLHTFTVSPHKLTRHELAGYSFRNREYNELSRVQAMLHRYSNITPIIYTSSPQSDIFEKIKTLHPYIDQPLRNIFNCHWYFDSLIDVNQRQGRVLLTGEQGNATLSWSGFSSLSYLRSWSRAMYRFLLPYKSHKGFLDYLNPDLLYSQLGKRLIRQALVRFFPHTALLSGYYNASPRGAISAINLWYGTVVLDPTADIALTEFCYNLPQWVFYKARPPIKRRLLVREGLTEILPQAIRENIYRGEQAADWYLQYNMHAKKWQQQSMSWSKSTQIMLEKMYDVSFLQQLFLKYPQITHQPDLATTRDIPARLVRFLSAGLYFNDL